MQNLPWIVALVALALLSLGLGVWGWRGSRRTRPTVLPTDWALAARPVFGADERRVHRLLREALPHHVVLSKLPLVRFCQPTDPGEVRYWYDLLGNSHVTFAVCSANGRMLAAIDLDSDRSESPRRLQIKQSVLSACQVRYLRCAVDQLPSVAELQLLVPNSVLGSRTSQPGPMTTRSQELADAPHPLDAAGRRAERTPLWQDSAVLRDSFFSPDSRRDSFPVNSRQQPPAAARATPASPRRSRVREFLDTDFDPSRFPQRGDEQDRSMDDDDDFVSMQADPPRFRSGSRR